MQGCNTWTSEGIVNILTKLEAISLPIDMKKDIQSALTKVMVHDTSSQKVNGSTIESLSPYLTQADWNILHQCNHFASLHVLAKSLAMLKEDAKKQARGILIHVSLHHGTGYEMPSGIALTKTLPKSSTLLHLFLLWSPPTSFQPIQHCWVLTG